MKKWLSLVDIPVLDPQSETAKDQAFLISFSFGLMMIVLVIVFLLMARFIWKYRETEKNKNTIPEDVKGNMKLELTWTIFFYSLIGCTGHSYDFHYL
jgi:cytochrome c oxidase subunit 2